jgi:hypothetical protein
MGTGSFPVGKERPGRDADLSPPSSAVVMKELSYTSTFPVGCTASTEPQCTYKGALYLPFTLCNIELSGLCGLWYKRILEYYHAGLRGFFKNLGATEKIPGSRRAT